MEGGTSKEEEEPTEEISKSETFTSRILRTIPSCWRSFKSDVDSVSSDSDSYEVVNGESSEQKLNYERLESEKLDYEKFACLPPPQASSPIVSQVASDNPTILTTHHPPLQRRLSSTMPHYEKYACLQRKASPPPLSRSYRRTTSTNTSFSRQSMYSTSTSSEYTTCCPAHLKHYRSCQTIPRHPYGGSIRRQAMDRDRGDTREQVMNNRRPHSVDLGGLERSRHPWLSVIPGTRNKPKQLDELSYEFRRAGIGVCFEGNNAGQ